MKHHLNTLFVTTPGCYLRRRGGAVVVELDGEQRLHAPLLGIGSIMCFGAVGASPGLLGLCAEAGVPVTFLTASGRLLATVHGFDHGNVLLRRAQYRWADDPSRSTDVARSMVAAKIANSRTALLRAGRDNPGVGTSSTIAAAVGSLAAAGKRAVATTDLDSLRGTEGDAAATYFGVFGELISNEAPSFQFRGRNRRPPTDPANALLSFVYTLLQNDARSACAAVGLDASVGFLHRDRPGRPGMALDLMEEFRPILGDRVVLALINRRQVTPDGFIDNEAGGIKMTDDTRKTVLMAYQRRKQDTIRHPYLGDDTTVGLLVHLQARLLSRYIRGDLDAYPAFVWR